MTLITYNLIPIYIYFYAHAFYAPLLLTQKNKENVQNTPVNVEFVKRVTLATVRLEMTINKNRSLPHKKTLSENYANWQTVSICR